ncbi:hypothetical protein [Clostridium tagluense]|uniref:DUF559 domain-containing protein n=1 Tax=Clostridium tagluense TaxID=360422 RepID=A0A401UTK8_9CLOT|nr:hypothetical protein [Clostridium tagluense]GCD12885.1 hypothetical protein Ctaglu_45080 [Clostridium tagluense]
MIKMYYEDLPRKKNNTSITIDWNKTIGHKTRFIHGNIEGEVKIVKYEKNYLWIKYGDKKLFKIDTDAFKRCRLSLLLEKRTNKFKIEIGQVFKDNKRDLIIIGKEYRIDRSTNQNKKWYKYRCNICGFCDDRSWIVESNLLSKKQQGCSCCAGKIVVEHINSILSYEETHWMIKFFQYGYNEAKEHMPQSNKKIFFKCPDCNRIKDKSISISNLYINHSIGCSCSDGFSFGHKYIHNLLEQLKFNFISNHTYDWCKFYNPYKGKQTDGEYDFIIEDMKIIIEVDGGFHRKDNKMNEQSEEESNFLDEEKNRLAEEQGYKVIRVIYNDDFEMKKSTLESEMRNYFDLGDIDWTMCECFALSNLCKKACEIKRDNINLTTTEIGKIVGLGKNTIQRYLKKGNKIWDWCNYDGKEESRKNGNKSGRLKVKPVEIFNKDDISLGKFFSGVELSRQSENLFGVKLNRGSISQVCNNKAKQYKGYTFKYIEDNLKEAI